MLTKSRSRQARPRGWRLPLLALVVLLALLAAPVGAQPATATVNINTWQCPSDYDRVSDCTKTGGVVVRVTADGEVAGEVTTVPDASADVEVPVGASVTVEVIGGAPADTTLEPATTAFTAVEGANPVTLIFLKPAAGPEPLDSDGDGLSDAREAELGTDPAAYDTDADGVADGGEVAAGTNPLAPDTDDDGFTDKEELDAASDPLDPPSVPVQPAYNSITVTAFTCPAGYEGKDLFATCTTPAAGVDFVVSLDASEFAVTRTTDANGAMTVDELGSGAYSVHEDLGDLGFSLQRLSVNCFGEPVVPSAPEPRQVTFTYQEESGFGLNLTQGETISCTWFNIPVAGAVQTPMPTSTPTPATPAVRLPSTGSGPGETADALPSPSLPLAAGAALALTGVTLPLARRRRA